MTSLFWKDEEGQPALSDIEKCSTAWELPDLTRLPSKLEGLIAFDLETRDMGISANQGPSWPWRGGGRVVGYSFAADNWKGYLPIGHEGGGNLDPIKVRQIINGWMSDPLQPKVGANVLYDLGWSRRDGVEVKGPVYDVQWAEALLDEHRWGYALDGLSKSYLNEGKDETLLKQAASAWGVDPKSGLWKLPSAFVGPYAEADADRTRRVFEHQVPKLKEQKLWDLFLLECSLLPLYLDMRWRGVRVDADKAVILKRRWTLEVQAITDEIKRRTGIGVDLFASESLSKALDTQNIPYPRTAKTKAPSVTADWLTTQDHWLTDLMKKGRELSKLSGTFIDGALLGHIHDGRIHTEYHPLRGEDGGTISGRLSSSNPNLQQMPSRTEEGRHIRSCFLPEKGEQWYACDYSQQEPRLTVHFAATAKQNGRDLPGSMEAVQRYKDNPRLSYHQMVADETGLTYKEAKILNLALTYGMGVKATAFNLKVTEDKAREYIAKYHERVPFVKALDQMIGVRVERDGELKTLLGRICRFPMWEPAEYSKTEKYVGVPLWKARKQWPDKTLKRAWLHKKLNRLIQGSAADQTKKAMKDLWDSGLGSHALVQVHDEVGFSFPKADMAREAARIMVDALPLAVPSIVDIECGPNWGDCEELV